MGSIPRLERSPGEGNGNPLQYSCVENPMDREAWWATDHAVTKELDTTQLLNHNNNISTECFTNVIPFDPHHNLCDGNCYFKDCSHGET